MENFEFDLESEDDVLEAFTSMRGMLPKQIVTMLNPVKLKQVMEIVTTIVAGINRQCDDAKFSLSFDRALGLDIEFKIVAEMIDFDTDAIAKLKQQSCDVVSAISVWADTEGRATILILFEDVKSLMPVTDNE